MAIVNIPAHGMREFFERWGGLHDSVVQFFSWSGSDKTIAIGLDDLEANFRDDQGAGYAVRPVRLTFEDVEGWSGNIKIGFGFARVSNIESSIAADESYLIVLELSPGGQLEWRCNGMLVEELELRS